MVIMVVKIAMPIFKYKINIIGHWNASTSSKYSVLECDDMLLDFYDGLWDDDCRL